MSLAPSRCGQSSAEMVGENLGYTGDMIYIYRITEDF
jgi:hypothetical protein